MKDLKYFYNNHYKSKNSIAWAELSERQKNALENSSEYAAFQLQKAIIQFKTACSNECDKLIDIVKKIHGTLK